MGSCHTWSPTFCGSKMDPKAMVNNVIVWIYPHCNRFLPFTHLLKFLQIFYIVAVDLWLFIYWLDFFYWLTFRLPWTPWRQLNPHSHWILIPSWIGMSHSRPKFNNSMINFCWLELQILNRRLKKHAWSQKRTQKMKSHFTHKRHREVPIDDIRDSCSCYF